MDIGSSDLELGMETKDNIDPMLIGLRFTNIAIPKGSLISKAYLQFTVDNTNKNTDPCNLFIYAESTSNSISFDGSQPFNLSKEISSMILLSGIFRLVAGQQLVKNH